MLARDVVDFGLETLQHLRGRVELGRLGEVGNVPGVEHEGGSRRKSIHLPDRFQDGRRRVLVRLLREAEVRVADLDEREIRAGAVLHPAFLSESPGGKDPSRYGPQEACARPGGAFEKAPPVDPVTGGTLILVHRNSPLKGRLSDLDDTGHVWMQL